LVAGSGGYDIIGDWFTLILADVNIKMLVQLSTLSSVSVLWSATPMLWHHDARRGTEADHENAKQVVATQCLTNIILLKSCADIFAPIVAHLATSSF